MVEKIAIVVAIAASAVALPILVLSVISNSRLFTYLRAHHHETWLQLDSPPSSGLNVTFAPMRFIASGAYIRINDPELWQLARAARRWFRTYMFLFVVLLVALLVAAAFLSGGKAAA